MRYLKVLVLAAALSAALMGFAGGASATTVTTTTGGAAATPAVHLVNEGGHVKFTNLFPVVECGLTFEGNTSSHGAEATTKIELTSLLFSCTGWHFTTVSPGYLEIHWTSGHNGTVTWTGTQFELTRLGMTCVYRTNKTSIGTLIGGNPATLKFEGSVPIDPEQSGGLCAASGDAKWGGSVVTTSALYVAP